MQCPSPGRIVHYMLPDEFKYAGEHRPAMIVKVWGSPPHNPFPVQLQVFMDGSNDVYKNELGTIMNMVDGHPNTMWKTSVPYSEEPKPGTWHFPEFVPNLSDD